MYYTEIMFRCFVNVFVFLITCVPQAVSYSREQVVESMSYQVIGVIGALCVILTTLFVCYFS